MTVTEAIDLIRPAVPTGAGTWADFGAGNGTFTEALAELIGEDGTVIAIDRDRSVMHDLQHLAARRKGAAIRVVAGDVAQLGSIAELKNERLDGALFGNVLHFFAEPRLVLSALCDFLQPNARIVIVEYDRRSASQWVPHPLPPDALSEAARAAGLPAPVEIGRRASRYQGELYCALIVKPSWRGST